MKTKDEKQELIEKVKKIGLDLNEIPNIFKINQKIKYKPSKEYNNSAYKVYHFVDIKNIEIYLTKTTRLDAPEKKYKLAEPLINYLQPENEELLENYIRFLKMVKEIDVEKIKEIQLEQKKFQKKLPFEIKYKENFIWEIYYSDIEDKYFMMFPTEETRGRSIVLSNKKTNRTSKKQKNRVYLCANK